MELSPFLLIITNFLLLLSLSSYPHLTTSKAHNNFTDLESLLAFKSQVSDPFGILSTNWTTNTSFCSWLGITCNPWSRQRVTILDLRNIALHGTISPYLGNLSFLSLLDLSNCSLTGSIPSSLGRLPRLKSLILQQNFLFGPIPTTILNMSSLVKLYMPYNNLSGSLPSNGSFHMLPSIQTLSLSVNQFTGEISNLVGCKDLRSISLSVNEFSGNIPHGLGSLVELMEIMFGTNQFTGTIPTSLGFIPTPLVNLSNLRSLDLSFNKLEGQIPEGRVFSNINISSLIGNAALCGAPQLNFPPCSNIEASNSRRRLNSLKYILPIVAFGIVVLTSLYIIFRFRRKRKARPPTQSDIPSLDDHKMVSYWELVRATDNFSQDNLLGRGSFGSVFKGKLDDGLIVAIKVLNLEVEGASKSFDAECQALRTVRHRNLIKIISVCSNLDFKALILEFMPNGSLEEWLHSKSHCLDLLQRLNILIDVSLAIEYLHHHHPHTVLHCDLKPSNILLNEEMVAHVGDFGIAKLVYGDGKSIASASMPGTTGYIAPEYGSTGSISRMSDVYSFGILLLETITTKKPSDDMFGEEKSLREWICSARYNAEILDVVDRNLLKDNFGEEQILNMHRCLSSVIELGLLCSSYSPKERVPMKDVVPRLQRIKMEYCSH